MTSSIAAALAAASIVRAAREDFEVQRRVRPDHEPKRVEQRDDDGCHESSLSKNSRNLNRRNPYGVSGRHSRLVAALFVTGRGFDADRTPHPGRLAECHCRQRA